MTRNLSWAGFPEGKLSLLPRPVGFDLNFLSLPGEPVPEAGPAVLLRVFRQAAPDRIAMHVLKFLDEFGLSEDVEIKNRLCHKAALSFDLRLTAVFSAPMTFDRAI